MATGNTQAATGSEGWDDEADAVVVGAGLGGVSAAAVLARAGLRVLACERAAGPGGYAHAFRRGPYTIDPAIHFTLEAGDGQFLDLLLRHLQVRDQVELVRIDHAFRVELPGISLHVPADVEGYIDVHAERFPDDAAGIRRFVELIGRFSHEAGQLTMQLDVRELDEQVRKLPTFFRYRRATLADVLDEHVNGPSAKAALAAAWISFGLPPSQLSFYLYAQYLTLLLGNGAYYSSGGFQPVVDAFVTALERDGGELLVDTPVERILILDGAVTGVELAGGRRIRTSLVVSNADARHTFDDLVGTDHVPPRFVQRLHRMEPSLSAFCLYGATTLGLDANDATTETYIFSDLDHAAAYERIRRGVPDGVFCNVPSLLCPTLAPSGEHLISLSSLAPYDLGTPWSEAKDRYAAELLELGERVLPGIGATLTFSETATPVTLERFTGNHQGAAYGWSMRADQVATKRLAHETPLRGLYLSGHWTQEGSGSFRVMLSGVRTARLALQPFGLADTVPVL